MNSASGSSRSSARLLWQHGLDWLADTELSTRPSDRDRAFELARGLRKLGALPAYRGEVSSYVRRLWEDARVITMVRVCWESVHSAKTSRGRPLRSAPLYVPDMLICEHGLDPSTEERLATVAREAADALVAATAPRVDARSYRARKAELSAAMVAVDELRVLRERGAIRGEAVGRGRPEMLT
jgi:hypothetical protein